VVRYRGDLEPSQIMQQVPRRRRRGVGVLIILLVLAVALAAAELGFNALFHPWIFYVGGHFHALPYWEGWSRVHSDEAGGDYVLFVRLTTANRSSRLSPSSGVAGISYICTPKHERIRLSVSGGMAYKLPLDTIGQPITLEMLHRPWYSASHTDSRPNLQVQGVWADRAIDADDHASIGDAFTADGSVIRADAPSVPHIPETLHFTLKEGQYSDFVKACGESPH
jgi:hypothetical protein